MQMIAKHKNIAEYLQALANIAVILGIIFAIIQIRQTKQIESTRLAIDATGPTRAPDFLEAYGKLLDAYSHDPDMLNTESLKDDLTFVLNVYDNIAILYLHKLAAQDIIEARVHSAMAKLEPILIAMKWPRESHVNFEIVLKQMSLKEKNKKKERIDNEKEISR